MFQCKGDIVYNGDCSGIADEGSCQQETIFCAWQNDSCQPRTGYKCTDLSVGECYGSGVTNAGISGCSVQQSTDMTGSLEEIGVNVLNTFWSELPFLIGATAAIILTLWGVRYITRHFIFGGRNR